MLASLVKASVEEISWDGPPGISWAKLLFRLREAGHQMDAHQQALLWKGISTKQTPIFVRGRQLLKQPEDAETEDSDDRHCQQTRAERSKGKLVLNVPDAVRRHHLRLDAVPDIAENDLTRRALQLVAQRRWKGCSGALLSAELKVTAANLFYPLEGLRMAGLLVGVLTLPSKATAADAHGNLFYFPRFFDADSIEQNEVQILLKTSAAALQNKLVATLHATESKVAFEMGLRSVVARLLDASSLKPDISRRAAGRIYRSLRAELVASGKVECVRAWDPSSKSLKDALCLPGHSGQPDPVLAIEDLPVGQPDQVLAIEDLPLAEVSDAAQVRPVHEGSAGPVQEVSHPLPKASVQSHATAATTRSSGRSHGQQAEDLIRCCSQRGIGIIGPEVSNLLGIRRKEAERILNVLVKKKRVIRIFESDGKTHANRYFDSLTSCGSTVHAPEAGNKHTLDLVDGRASKALKSSSTGRVDVTLVRRVKRTSELLQEKGLLVPFELRKLGLQDNTLGVMDGKTAARILKALESTEERVGLRADDLGNIEFAFWKPTHTESSARQLAAENAGLRRESRFQKIRRPENHQPALMDRPWPWPGPTMPPSSGWPLRFASRRVLSQDVVAEQVRLPGSTEAFGLPRTLDQKAGWRFFESILSNWSCR